jgi:penicillin amidase
VVSGNNSTRGKPLLANDPHLELMAPSLWYLMHLQAPAAGVDVIGATFPGLPGVVIGRNGKVAWGVTNTGVDVQDLYVMEADGDKNYVFDGVSKPYDVRAEVIRVAGGADVTLPVRSSVHGPVVTDAGTGDGIVGSDVFGLGATLCLRWVSVDPSVVDTTFAAFYGLQFARNFTEFRDALRDWVAPSQNVVFAGDEGEGGAGEIGYQMPGWVPMRNLSFTHGAWPVPGNSSQYTWLPESPWGFDALPCTLNPKRGFVVRAEAPRRATPPPHHPAHHTATQPPPPPSSRPLRTTKCRPPRGPTSIFSPRTGTRAPRATARSASRSCC